MQSENEIIKEFQTFRRDIKTCNAIALSEVARFVQHKQRAGLLEAWKYAAFILKLKTQLHQARVDNEREPSPRTQGYIDALEWALEA